MVSFILVTLGLLSQQHAVSAFTLTQLTNTRSNHHGSVITLRSKPDGDVDSVRQVLDWAKKEPLDALLPRDEAKAIAAEILSSDSLIDDSEKLLSQNLKRLEEKFREEDRSFAAILGDDSTSRILKAVESIDEGYDSAAVRAFLSSDAINSLFSRILYDGIFEFFQKIDVFGNIISNLPIIGPIRKQIVAGVKTQLDGSLRPLVQQFLKAYTTVAVVQASDYVLSPANRKLFASANAKLIANILERPINTILPPGELSEKVQQASFDFIRNVEMDKVDGYVDIVYDALGDKMLESALDVDKVLDASPTLQASLARILKQSREADSSS